MFPDERGIVRSVEVSYGKRNKREKVEEYRSKPLVTEKTLMIILKNCFVSMNYLTCCMYYVHLGIFTPE